MDSPRLLSTLTYWRRQALPLAPGTMHVRFVSVKKRTLLRLQGPPNNGRFRGRGGKTMNRSGSLWQDARGGGDKCPDSEEPTTPAHPRRDSCDSRSNSAFHWLGHRQGDVLGWLNRLPQYHSLTNQQLAAIDTANTKLSQEWQIAFAGVFLVDGSAFSAYPEQCFQVLESIHHHRFTIGLEAAQLKPRWKAAVTEDVEQILLGVDRLELGDRFAATRLVRNLFDRLGGAAKKRQSVLRCNQRLQNEQNSAVNEANRNRMDRLRLEAQERTDNLEQQRIEREDRLTKLARDHEMQLKELESRDAALMMANQADVRHHELEMRKLDVSLINGSLEEERARRLQLIASDRATKENEAAAQTHIRPTTTSTQQRATTSTTQPQQRVVTTSTTQVQQRPPSTGFQPLPR